LNSLEAFLFQYAAEGVLVVDADGVIERINPAAVALLNLTDTTLVGVTTTQLFAADRALMSLLTDADQKMVPLSNERMAQGVAKTLDGKRYVLLHDVTEQQTLETGREALIRRVAHDLKNPLNALNGYADLVERTGELNDAQHKFLKRISQTTSKLYEVANKLVDIAWIEAGMPLQHVPVELASITREVLSELAPAAHKKQIYIINSIPNEFPPVMGDPKRLQQTIYYLLDNAITYSLTESHVAIHAWHQENEVSYMVADQGIGITPDEHDKIWDRMWRSSDERVREIPGGGIGLAFAKTIIQRHGGHIWVESDLDQGATFTFKLPLVRGG